MAGRYDTCGEYLFSCCRRHIVWAADTPGDPTSERKTAKNAESPGSSEVGHNAQTLITWNGWLKPVLKRIGWSRPKTDPLFLHLGLRCWRSAPFIRSICVDMAMYNWNVARQSLWPSALIFPKRHLPLFPSPFVNVITSISQFHSKVTVKISSDIQKDSFRLRF